VVLTMGVVMRVELVLDGAGVDAGVLFGGAGL
jgi:hypothetical protein